MGQMEGLGMTLEYLALRNVQIHKKLDLELDPRLTCFLGNTDKGKSAILRVLRWLFFNRPQGDGIRRWGSKSTRATLGIDGHTATRSKGKENLYKLDGQVYKAFGSQVPEDLAQLFNVSEGSWAGQLQAPFWFLLPPQQLSRELNKVVSLDLIDSTLANLVSQVRQNRERVKWGQERLAAAQVQRDALAWAKEADAQLQACEHARQAALQARGKAVALAATLAQRNAVQGKLATLKGQLQGLQAVARAAQAATTARKHAQSLADRLAERDQWHAKVKKLGQHAKSLGKQIAQQFGSRCPACGSPTTTP